VIAGEIDRWPVAMSRPDELDKAKKYLMGSYGLRFDTSTKIARELLQAQLDELGMDYFRAPAIPRSRPSRRPTFHVCQAGCWTPRGCWVVIVGQPVGL